MEQVSIKKGEIQQAFEMHKKGLSIKEIAAELKVSERSVRGYIWRAENPEKYKEIVKRYFEKRKAESS